MSKALEYTKDIVVAAFNGTEKLDLFKLSGQNTAEFFEAIYKKIKELEDSESNEQASLS